MAVAVGREVAGTSSVRKKHTSAVYKHYLVSASTWWPLGSFFSLKLAEAD